MRCIEMCFSVLCVVENALINRNMRCIEIWSAGEVRVLPLPINRNMRCIEIDAVSADHEPIYERLIETWDVLKYEFRNRNQYGFSD